MSAATIRRVRVLGGGCDPLLAGLRLSRLLTAADIAPSALPPSAVLLVRALSDPLPGSLPLDGGASLPPRAWERAASDRLALALRAAARPAREAVPAAAESVLFADRAELLGCLARDACDGSAPTRWWWRALDGAPLPGAAPQAVVAERWLAAPEDVPAALELLAEQRLAARVVAWLPAAACEALGERLAAQFALPAPRAAPASPTSPSAPPWAAVVPEAAALDPPRAHLLGVALTLRRTPALARTPAFATAVAAWLAGEASPASVALSEPPDPTAPPVGTASPESGPGSEGPTAPPSAVPRRLAAPAPEPGPSPASRAGAPAAPARSAIPDQAPPATPVSPGGVAGAPSSGRSRPPTPRILDVGAAPARGPAPAASRRAPKVRWDAPPVTGARPDDDRRLEGPPIEPPSSAAGVARDSVAAPGGAAAGRVRSPTTRTAGSDLGPFALGASPVRTNFGGAFYLLNLALFLDLYADFTRPLEVGIALDPWDLIALLARRLAGPAIRSDPLWPLLARLAGRSARTPPGAGFRPPPSWRTPRAWLVPFDHAGEWRWSAAHGTLRLIHPAGFAVAAVPRTRVPPRDQLSRELGRVPAPIRALRRHSLPAERTAPLDRWVDRLGGYAIARLRLALGLEPGEDLAGLLLGRRATVFVTAAHVDVVLSLADLPLSVRLAGLDRTPGWVPAAGRHIVLHFR